MAWRGVVWSSMRWLGWGETRQDEMRYEMAWHNTAWRGTGAAGGVQSCG